MMAAYCFAVIDGVNGSFSLLASFCSIIPAVDTMGCFKEKNEPWLGDAVNTSALGRHWVGEH